MELTTHPHLTPSWRMSRAIPLPPPTPPHPPYLHGTLWGEKKLITYRNHSVIVSKMTRLQAGQCDFKSPYEQEIFLFKMSKTGPRPYLASYYIGTVGSCSPGVKWLGHEADHWPPYSTMVKNDWGYTSTPPIRLHGACRKNFNPDYI